MSVKVMAHVWEHSTAAGGDLLVMLALADFANDAGECWPSIPVLAEKARLTERQTRKILSKLEGSKEIRLVRSNGGRNRRNHYFIELSKYPEKETLKKEQGNKNPVPRDIKTLSPATGALNRHRTINNYTRDQQTAFEDFYRAYPLHVGKAEAFKAWKKLAPDAELVAKIQVGVGRYAESVKNIELQYIKHPGPWLNARRWEDEPAQRAPRPALNDVQQEVPLL